MVNQFITRAQWGARSPKATVYMTPWSTRNAFFTHYSSAHPTQTIRQIQNYHMDTNGWADIGYNFLVDVYGNKYEGRQGTWLAIGAHAANNNTRGIGVCFIGRNGDATIAAKRAIRDIYDEACQRAGRQLQKLGHRDVNPTSCPGDDLWNWIHAGMIGGVTVTPEEAEAVWNAPSGDYARWRLDALLHARDNFAGGPEEGTPVPLIELIRSIAVGGVTHEALVAAVKEALEDPDTLATVAAALKPTMIEAAQEAEDS